MSVSLDSKKSPVFSFVVPVYNTENYIKNTITSIKNQTFKDFEIVFVDDSSPDNAVEVIKKELCDTSIPYKIVSQPNSGLGAARNTGVKNADGEWILFVDSDDAIQPYTLELYNKIIDTHPNINFMFCDFIRVSEENVFQETQKNENFDVLSRQTLLNDFLVRRLAILVPGAIYRRTFLIEKDIWHPHLRWSEDQHFMWRIIDNVNEGIHVKSNVYNYLSRSADTSIMTSTQIDKIIIAYNEYIKLTINDQVISKYLLSRWVLGCLNALAHRNDKKSWLSFFEQTDGKKHLKTLKSFPSFKVKVLARLGLLNKSLLYRILRSI